jgi:hypothetical protein
MATFGIALLLSLACKSAADAQLQPVTTTVLCNSVPTCTAAQLPNVNAATLRRAAGDVLGRSHIAVLIMHPHSGYTSFAACAGLTQRGFTTLCINGPFNGNQFGYYGLEQSVPSLRSAMNYLRNIVSGPAITKVVLLGHSGGGALMTFYQNIAENGPGACTGPEKIIPCVTDNLSNLPKADGVISFDGHLGNAFETLTYVDPAVIGNVLNNRDPSLDMFSAANGYNAATDGAVYSSAFAKRFTAAQAVRNSDLISQALDLLQQRRIQTGSPNDMGDSIPFDVVGSIAARLFQPDLDFVSCTKNVEVLLARDGTRPTQKICSVRTPSGRLSTGLIDASTQHVNVHIWLGAQSLRTNGRYTQALDDVTGIDYASSNTSTVNNLQGITVPELFIANGAHYFVRPVEIEYQLTKSIDKTYAVSEGAVHGSGPCADCARIILNNPNLTDAQANAYWTDPAGNGPAERSWNFMTEWLSARY